jgi:NADPH-dependent curcumin reductase CurA
MGGFLLTDYAARYGEAWRELAGWLAAGQLRSREQVVEGLDAFPDTLLKLFRGENTGKLILKVAED